ncbi:MAG: ABC transporter ATP-binding protein [Deltaproteobacteria bacterium]|nr:ABC transporter ATP-binding protein [Deltaproteobacteria bacterium]
MNSAAVRLDQITKFYEEGNSRIEILQSVTNEFIAGKFSVLLGKSGSGKSTLLNLISGIDTPSSGDVWIGDTPITRISERGRTIFRRDRIGIIFQFFNLIPTLSVLENVTLPLELGGHAKTKSRLRAMAILERIGLENRSNAFPDRLSGGEQQRVAIARAIAHDPDLVLADEPTGNLDVETGKQVLSILIQLTRDTGKTMIMATHSADVISLADDVYNIKNGQLIAVDGKKKSLSAST